MFLLWIVCALQCVCLKLPANWFYQTWSLPPYFLRWFSRMWQQNVKVLSVSEVACKTETMNTSIVCITRGMLNNERTLTAFKNEQTNKKTHKKPPKYRKGSAREECLGYWIELSASLRSIVPIAYSSSANQCYFQKLGIKKMGLLYDSFQILCFRIYFFFPLHFGVSVP